jgi:16S rRNA A1518/A1519 N6-dimethyltransferase RsmA/KsgA/DIM1 with predicted DNA glycosylase/AP lyase activity
MLLQPYIELPFPLVNHVVTTIFHGKQKQLINTVKQLFPKALCQQMGKSIPVTRNEKCTGYTVDILGY